jgi:hypothetical protein
MDILISEQKLSDVNSMPPNKPKEIIDSTKGATVNGNKAKVKDVTENSITLEVSADLGDGPYLIVLTKEPSGGEILALLGYDRKTQTLLPKKEEDQINPYNEIVEAINHVAKATEESPEIKKGFDQVADAIKRKKAGSSS